MHLIQAAFQNGLAGNARKLKCKKKKRESKIKCVFIFHVKPTDLGTCFDKKIEKKNNEKQRKQRETKH